MIRPLIARLRAYLKSRRERRQIAQLERLLAGAVLSRYTDDSLAWLTLHGHRFYFDGAEAQESVTTYQPEERKRRLIKTNY